MIASKWVIYCKKLAINQMVSLLIYIQRMWLKIKKNSVIVRLLKTKIEKQGDWVTWI